MTQHKGFTLVELAIVITIIGLLIGGVLKGQELLENARMTSAASQLKSWSSATITFKDIYKALPGDMLTPANFIQNCTTAPCNIAGDNNGMIGGPQNWYTDESLNFWLHMAKAGLISGVDPGSTWSGTYFTTTGSQPSFSIAARMGVIYFNDTAYIRNGVTGHYWHGFAPAGANPTPSIPRNTVAKFDLKIDDGKPRTGSVILYGYDALVGDNYDPNDKTLSYLLTKTDF